MSEWGVHVHIYPTFIVFNASGQESRLVSQYIQYPSFRHMVNEFGFATPSGTVEILHLPHTQPFCYSNGHLFSFLAAFPCCVFLSRIVTRCPSFYLFMIQERKVACIVYIIINMSDLVQSISFSEHFLCCP